MEFEYLLDTTNDCEVIIQITKMIRGTGKLFAQETWQDVLSLDQARELRKELDESIQAAENILVERIHKAMPGVYQ